MKKVYWLAAVVTLVAVPSLVFGQLKEQAEPVSFSRLLTSGLTNPQGLAGIIGLDPNRFTMQQSYSLSYMSIGGNGFSQGVYLNTIGYRLMDSMQLSVQWGIRNQPLSSLGVSGISESGFFLSGANFEYKPARNVSIGIQYSTYPSRYYGPYRAVNPYYSSPMMEP